MDRQLALEAAGMEFIDENGGGVNFPTSFDDFVRGSEQRRWNGEAERGCRLDVNGKIKLGRLLNRNVAGLCSMQNLVNHVGRSPEQIGVARSIGHETTGLDIIVIAEDCRQMCADRQPDDAGAVGGDERI